MKPVDDEIKWIKYSILKSSIEWEIEKFGCKRLTYLVYWWIKFFYWTYKDYSLCIDFLTLASVTYNYRFINQLEKLCIGQNKNKIILCNLSNKLFCNPIVVQDLKPKKNHGILFHQLYNAINIQLKSKK